MRFFLQPAGARCVMQPFSGVLLAVVLGWLTATMAVAASAEPEDDGFFLPANRELERTLDKARRLLAENRWSDAATLCDEILASPRDAFIGDAARRDTSRSIKAEAWALVQTQPRAAAEAYSLLFSARAERQLNEALSANDLDAAAEVARRWFATPAGRRAALISAVVAIESGQPAVAAAWLDRLAECDAFDAATPTLAIMRSIAHAQAGETDVALRMLAAATGRDRIAGEGVELSMPAERAARWLASIGSPADPRVLDWAQPRGDAARNATVVASRPLLVPRYRVPLTRHPEESRLLNQRAQAAKAFDRFLMPAATPIAIDGLILSRTPLGILAVDFATGKRLWLRTLEGQPGGDAQADDSASDDAPAAATDEGEWAFENLTSTALAAAKGLVFAVDVPPGPPADRGPLAELNAGRRGGHPGPAGNRLRAFDIAARGAPRWQLPAAGKEAWYLGAPLAAGGTLFVLVEEKGEIRLDVVDARQGTVSWSQPLAELDEDEQISSVRSRSRRLAGLSPALADGVVVCPLGTGAIVGIDLASRTLLWAHRYARGDRHETERGATIAEGAAVPRKTPFVGDSSPVIAGGRVLLAARDATGLICLDLRSGKPAWETPVTDVVQVAGVVEKRAVVIGQRAVEARALADGSPLWQIPYTNLGGRPSGRGIVTPERILLPLDTPEVVELDLRDGTIVGRSSARGGLIPGNLVAYRGEVISRGIDSLDVFHQQAALEAEIRTAEARDPQAPWVLQWRGQLLLEAGRIAEGLDLLTRSIATAGHRVPPETLPDAIVFGMQRDFAAAAPAWRQASRTGGLVAGGSATARGAARVAIEGFLRIDAWDDAWAAIRELLVAEPGPGSAIPTRDPADSALMICDDRWLAGRLDFLQDRAPKAVRDEIAAAAAQAVTAAATLPQAAERLLALAERLDPLPEAARARELAAAAIESAGDDTPAASLRREWQLLRLMMQGTPASRERARSAIATSRAELLRGTPTVAIPHDSAWPLGRVDARRLPLGRDTFASGERGRLIPLPVDVGAETAVPGLRLACDAQEGQLHVFDGYGRPVVEPLTVDSAGARLGLPWLPQASGFEAWTLGRMLFVRTGRTLSAYDLAGGGRAVWTHTGPGGPREPAVGLWARDHGGGGRHGGIPVGLEITEPEERSRPGQARGGRPRLAGAMHFEGGTLAVLDPCSGDPLWERHGLPASADLVGDDEYVTVCTLGGTQSLVLSLRDGRLVRRCDLPGRRQRLAASGRRIVAARPLDEPRDGRVARTVQLILIDPVADEPIVLGTVDGESRAVPVDDLLVVLDPAGELNGFDLTAGSLAFRLRLPSMPPEFDRLHVVPFDDRLLVVAGSESRTDGGEWAPGLGDLAPLQHLFAAGEITRPLSGAIWAVGRADGSLLWPAPVVVDRHSLHLSQPQSLPVLLLSRHFRDRHDAEQVRLGLVALDKRTGHAVFAGEAEAAQPHAFFSCELTGDPERHSITLRETGDAARWTVLDFTGGPMPPRTPFQGRGAWPGADRLLEQMHSTRRSRP